MASILDTLTDQLGGDTLKQLSGLWKNGQTVVCEPGVVLDDINKALANFDRKIGPDPSSANRAVIGGVVANNSTGSHSLDYGFIADHVESIEAVLADGSLSEFKNNFNPDEESD